MSDKFAKHKQPWKADEVAKLRTLAAKGKKKAAPKKKAAARIPAAKKASK